MGDLCERIIEFYSITDSEINKIFYDFNRSKVLRYSKINIGMRNSNYIVITDKESYLLRICPPNCDGYKNEIISYNILKEIINMPKILLIKDINYRKYIIYEYIESISISKVSITKDIILKVAKSAANIHNISKEKYLEYDLFEYPPFNTWFNIFLNNKNTIERLGKVRINKINKLLSYKEEELKIIDTYKGFTHNDFRPENMIIDSNNNIYIVDWEYGNYGHILGDIGQFFRSNEEISNLKLFKEVYNKYSNTFLPDNWIGLCKLRDLANLIQMIGSEEETPIKFKVLIKLIDNTINYFSR